MTDRPGLFALHGVIRPYAWGSRTAIPELLGTAPTGEPAAELWLGAHPDDPSLVPAHDDTLDRLIAADPFAMLGAANVERFGPQLPFLLKVLAADTALSIQVHPDLAQAKAGFAAEDARGVARDSPQRNYKDANHKPELLCALTPFDALCGFRPVAQTVRLFDALGVEALAPYREMLAGPDGLRAAFTTLLDLDDPGRSSMRSSRARDGSRLHRTGRPRPAGWCGSPASTRAISAPCWRCCSTSSTCNPERRSSWPRATSTPTCTARASKCWPTATMCFAAV